MKQPGNVLKGVFTRSYSEQVSKYQTTSEVLSKKQTSINNWKTLFQDWCDGIKNATQAATDPFGVTAATFWMARFFLLLIIQLLTHFDSFLNYKCSGYRIVKFCFY